MGPEALTEEFTWAPQRALEHAAVVKGRHSKRVGVLWEELANTADKGGGKLVGLFACVFECV